MRSDGGQEWGIWEDSVLTFTESTIVCFTESPAVYFASVNAKLLSLSDTPIFSFVSNMRRRICLNLMFRASAFFFKSWWPFFAPPSRFLMTASTVTVGTTTYLFPAPLIAN